MRKILVVSVFLLYFISSNVKAQWTKTNGPEGGSITAIASDDTRIFVGTNSGGIYLSTDGGNSWSIKNNGLINLNLTINSLAIHGNVIYAGTLYGLFESYGTAELWEFVDPIFLYTTIFSVTVSENNIFVGTYDYGLVVSKDGGATWHQKNNGFTHPYIMSIVVSDTNIFAATDHNGVYISTDSASSWSPVNNGLTDFYINALVKSGNKIFAGTQFEGVFVTSNNGALWTKVNNGFPSLGVYTLSVKGTDIYAGTYGKIFLSTNFGASWAPVNSGLPNSSAIISTINLNSNKIIAGDENGSGIFISSDNGLTWNESNTGLTATNVISLETMENYIFAGTWGAGLFYSNDNGNSWSRSNNGLIDLIVYVLKRNGNKLYAGTSIGLFLSTDFGASWTNVTNGIIGSIHAIIFNGTKTFVGTGSGGVFLSIDSGLTWNPINNGLTDTWVNALVSIDSTIFAGTFSEGVFVSTNNGNLWTSANFGITDNLIHALTVNGSYVFAGTHDRLNYSNNNGAFWENGFPGTIAIYSLASYGSHVYAGSYYGDLYSLADNGSEWIATPTNLQDVIINAIAISGENIFAGTQGCGVYVNTQLLSGAEVINKNNLNSFLFPNPAHESFSIQTNSELKNPVLEIFDLMGGLVYTKSFQGQFKFNTIEISPKLSSGIYFVKLSDPENQFVEKLILENH